MIKEFQGEYRWLSNFAPINITLDNIVYPSVEHAYQSAKCNNILWKYYCSNNLNTAGKIKRESKSIELIPNWNNIKLSIMKECLIQKFNQEPYKTLLYNTRDEYIQEGNRWNDRYWGVCLKTNIGENMLGKLIMYVRMYNKLNYNTDHI